MSGHRRVKDIAYDDDDVDDYSDEYADEGEEEMTEEDKEQMRAGKAKVREALGADYTTSVSDKAIEESLWHYYYDIAKTVTYLKNQHKPAQPKMAKQPSRFDQAAGAAAKAQPKKGGGEYHDSSSHASPPIGCPSVPESCHIQAAAAVLQESTRQVSKPEHHSDSPIAFPLPMFLPPREMPRPTADFFSDTPWLNVPSHRLGCISVDPIYPRGRLLGGSSKPSKLAALAAARKKKQEEAKANSAAPEGQTAQQPDRAVQLLDRLGNKAKTEAKPAENQSSEATTTTISDKTNGSEAFAPKAPAIPLPIRKRKGSSPSPPREEKIEPAPEPEPKRQKFRVEDLKAPPSAFAVGFLGLNGSEQRGQPKPQSQLPQRFYPWGPEYVKAKINPFADPSPDDVVLAAQSKATKKQTPAAKAAEKDKPNGITKGVSELTVEETPRIKHKNLNVLEEFEKSTIKNAANFVVIGHVDHGKSTLMGRLLYDLKVVDQRSIDKLRKEAQNIGKSSFALAWVMDETSEERSRGVTVDIATNSFETEKTRYTILDAPGHKDFVPNMIAGASQADFAVLVIDAGTNSFESGLRGQTKEHALLARSIGVQRLIVAVNKMDSASWSQERFEEISQQMSAFLTTAGFQTKNIAFVPCAGLTGENIVTPVAKDLAPWYTGKTLVEELDASEPSKRAIEKPLRMTVADIFRGGVTNPLSISGRLDAGSLQVGDHIVAMPAGETAFIKGIEVDHESVDWAVAGQIATLHLTDIDAIHLRLGDIVCTPSAPIKNISRFEAKILAFEHVTPMHVDVLRARLNVPARVAQLVALLDKSSGETKKRKPRVVQPGAVARVVVEMVGGKVPLEEGVRVVLRCEGATVAAGLVEKVG
ncbi:uncharacterized protein K452DRAFT_320517 [Aplosporella prunicola CBS 121167]|uniref:Elongation factor 1 alpha-like protein n=1 Tax=Aplosporella prunicola CBS 121167 TaxID=1176127 RepID=A0A6A6B5I6_9PEZI|nr:uncharacterized protein K452DRAFT_320517 [Aplosporella prunicola CBS 121167]KAF2139389.1 hypothetical protein K452DRAFT_320517 [Aplosporella prunicola CBS 121167]